MSLLEVVVAMSLVAVLVGLAVPGYQRYAMRGYRVAAIELLLDAARCQSRIYASEYHYDTTRCERTDPAGRYDLTFEPGGAPNSAGFTVTALPRGRQQADPCGSLSLDHTGRRTVGSGEDLLRRCWGGR